MLIFFKKCVDTSFKDLASNKFLVTSIRSIKIGFNPDPDMPPLSRTQLTATASQPPSTTEFVMPNTFPILLAPATVHRQKQS